MVYLCHRKPCCCHARIQGLKSSRTSSSSIRHLSTLKFPIKLPLSLSPPAGTSFIQPENSDDLRPRTQRFGSRRPFSTAIEPRTDESPLKLFPIECNNPSYEEYESHRDVHHDGVDKGVERFCGSNLARDTITIVDDVQDHPLHAWRWRYKDKYGVYLDFKVNWKVGCRTSQGFQDIQRPLGPDGPSCDDIMLANWKHCKSFSLGICRKSFLETLTDALTRRYQWWDWRSYAGWLPRIYSERRTKRSILLRT